MSAERIGVVGKDGFTCRECIDDENVYEDEDNYTVVMCYDDWKGEAGICRGCGTFSGDMRAA